MNSSAQEAFDKLDVKKNLGMDFYQFETHVRDFVLELVEPTIQKAQDDHKIVADLQNGYEQLRQKLETLAFDTQKFTKKAVSMNEFHLRTAEIERNIVKNSETLNTDFKKMAQNFEVVRDKLGIVQSDLVQFSKVNGTFQSDLEKVYAYVDNQKTQIVDEMIKMQDSHHEDLAALKKRFQGMEDEIKGHKHVANQHTQFIREFEVRMGIFQSNQIELLHEESSKMHDVIKHQLHEFDLKLLKQRIEMSDEVQHHLKHSKDDMLKTFRKEYNAKRVVKGTQANYLDNIPKQVDNIVQVEILPLIDIKVLEYEVDPRPKSNRRPRRKDMPRTNTPPPKKRTDYHLLPWRVCLTDSDKSIEAPSEIAERDEDFEMQKRIHLKEQAYLKKLAEEEEERKRKEAEEEERKFREKEEALKTMEELIVHSDKIGIDELRDIPQVLKEDPEVLFMREEEEQLQKFYEALFPKAILQEGVPDFSRFLKLINDQQFKPEDLLAMRVDSEVQRKSTDKKNNSSPKFNQEEPTNQFESINSFKLVRPSDTIERPQSPRLDMQQMPVKQQNYSQLFEYIQDGLLQLRDEMAVRLNDQVVALEQRHETHLAQIHAKLESGIQHQSSGQHQNHAGSFISASKHNTNSSRMAPNLGPSSNHHLNASQSFNNGGLDRRDTSDYGNIITQAAIEHASMVTIEKCRHEFLGGLNDQLRRAQARVIAHVRMENRNLLKLWSLRIRKEVVSWMAQAQQEMQGHTDYIQKVDDRGRQCEDKQFEILSILQKQMKSLEDNFTDLKEQQQKILFGSGESQMNDFPDSDDEDQEIDEDMDDVTPKSSIKTQGPVSKQPSIVPSRQNTSAIKSQIPEYNPPSGLNTPKQMSQQVTPRGRAGSIVQSQQQDQISNQSVKQQKSVIFSQQMVIEQPKSQHASSSHNNNQAQASSSVKSQHDSVQKPNLQLKEILNSPPQNTYQNQTSPKQVQSPPLSPVREAPELLHQETFAELKQAEIVDLIQQPQISPVHQEKKAPPVENQQPVQQLKLEKKQSIIESTPVETQRRQSIKPSQPEPKKEPEQTPVPNLPMAKQTSVPQQQRSPRAVVQNNKPSSPFKRPGPTPAPTTINTTVSQSSLRKGGMTMQMLQLNKAPEEPTPPKEVKDEKARDLLTKQKKKMQIQEMQLMTLLTQFKGIEQRQKDIEDFKVKDLVIEYFTQQFEWLNIPKLKQDFDDFQSRMTELQEEMNQKMIQVKILYDEVEAGFQRNARDRSDYLVHYDRVSNMTESSIVNFKDQVAEFQMRVEKLSTCVLAIVNEDEANQIKNYNPYNQTHDNTMLPTGIGNEDQTITVNIPQANEHHGMNQHPQHVTSLDLIDSQNPHIYGGASQNQSDGFGSLTPMGNLTSSQIMIPKRNIETGRFKNIADLANEITYQTARNKQNLAVYFDKNTLPQKNTLLPNLSNTKTSKLFNDTSNSAAKVDPSKFNYTEFLDQALITSLNNVGTLDLKNNPPPQYSNPLLRASVNGVISHRIKNLLGTNLAYGGSTQSNTALIYNNYSQKTTQQQDYAEDQSLAPKILLGGGTGRKKQASSLMHRDSLLVENSASIQSSMARLAKKELDFDHVKNLTGQKRGGGSQLDQYPLKLHKHITARDQHPSLHFRNPSHNNEDTPLVLQALVGAHSSKDTLNNLRKRKNHLAHGGQSSPISLEKDLRKNSIQN